MAIRTRHFFTIRAVVATFLLALCTDLRARPVSDQSAAAPPFSVAIVNSGSTQGNRMDLESLKGKAVVLEFWATWCSGCIAQIPHLNELTDKFKGQPITFLSITDEDAPVIARFLKKRSIAGLVGIDTEVFRAYGVEGRPRSALIDAQGRLVQMCSPDEVTEERLQLLISGKLEPHVQTEFKALPVGSEPNAPLPLFQVLIRPAMPARAVGFSPGAMKRLAANLQGYGFTIRGLLALAYSFGPENRIVAPDWCDESRFDFSVPAADKDMQSLRVGLKAAFGIQVRRENRQIDIYVLDRSSAPTNLREDESGWSAERLAQKLERLAGRPVAVGTGLAGRYAGKLPEGEDLNLIRERIRTEYGLELLEERREVPMLVVEIADQP